MLMEQDLIHMRSISQSVLALTWLTSMLRLCKILRLVFQEVYLGRVRITPSITSRQLKCAFLIEIISLVGNCFTRNIARSVGLHQ